MCLILFAYKAHPNYPLVIAANRDEFYLRPTKAAHFWSSSKSESFIAGKDLQEGGTWLGLTTTGRWTAITNYRQAIAGKIPTEKLPRSRGALSRHFLEWEENTNRAETDYFPPIANNQSEYGGFNLLAGDLNKLFYFSNRHNPIQTQAIEVEPGVHGLCNHLLNTPWPKVEKGKQLFQQSIKGDHINHQTLIELLADQQHADDSQLPNTGVGMELERMLSPLFIHSTEYGTRASTIITVNNDGNAIFTEQIYGKNGEKLSCNRHEFKIRNNDLPA